MQMFKTELEVMSEAPIAIVSCSLRGRQNEDDIATINASVLGNPVAAVNNDPSTSNQNQARVNRSTSKGWLTVGLVFIANFLVFGFFKSLGMLTKILNKEFAGATMNVYVLMCIMYSTNCAAGPLSCYLTRRYSARAMALVGTSMVTFGLILSWFARSLMFLYFSMGIFAGVGSGLTYPTGVILVSKYFTGTKNAAIANALVVSGSPIGGMVMPFVLSFLSELYTSRGAFLIIGAIMFHAIMCASAFRQPTETTKNETTASHSTEGQQAIIPAPYEPLDKADENLNILDEENNAKKTSNIHSCSTGILLLSGKEEQGRGRECGTTYSTQTVRKYQGCPPSAPPLSQLESTEKCVTTGKVTSNTINLDQLTVRRRGLTNILLLNNITQSRNASQVLSEVISQPYILALDHSCIILCPSQTDVIKQPKPVSLLEESAKSIPVGDGVDYNDNVESCSIPIAQADLEQNTGKSAKNSWTFISPLGDPLYVSLLVSNCSTAISTANVYLMVAQLVHETGDAYRKTSLIYLLFSSADLTGRIVGAFLCDKKLLTPAAIYAIGLVSAGISSSLLATLPTYMHLCIGTFVYGLSSGFHVGIYGLLLTNIVGIKKIHAGYGISMFINGTIQCMAILLSGSLISTFGASFTLLAPVFGGILAGGGTFWICGSFIFNKKQNTDSVQNDDQNR